MATSLSFTYAELIAYLQVALEDSSAEFVANIGTIVALGESRLATDLNFEIFDVIVTGALTVAVFTQAIKPTNWQGTRSLHIRDVGGTGVRRFLQRRTYEWCLDFEPDESATAEPLYYAELTDTEFWLTPAPVLAHGFELRQIQSPEALTATNSNTWLGDNAGDLLVYACLLAADQFLISDPADMEEWRKTYVETMPARKLELRRQWRSDYDPIMAAAKPMSVI